MRICVFTVVMFVITLCSGGCEKTEMAPAPGSTEGEMVAEIFKFMQQQDAKNREERIAAQKAMYKFLAEQNRQTRALMKSILKGGYRVPANNTKLESDPQQKIPSVPPEPKAELQEEQETKTEYFVEPDNRPKPVLEKWNPYAQHIDPRSFPQVDLSKYPVFPNEDRDADPDVPKHLGGKGFGAWALENGWQTNTTFPLTGDPAAKKGGQIVRSLPTFPVNLRPMGQASNTSTNYFLRYCMWQGFLRQHHITKEWCPNLATHWKHEGQTHYFRINPNAKWDDGSPVTSDDVLETYRYYVHPDMGDPMNVQVWENFDPPKKISKYIVSFTEKEKQWINWDRLAESFWVFPKKQLASIAPKDFNDKFNYYPMMGSGAYTIVPGDIVDDQSIQITRKKDWWAKDHRLNVGMFNFDRMKWIVILDRSLEQLKLRNGDLDVLYVVTSKLWVERMNFEEIQKGYIQKRMVFNHEPQGTQFLAMNMERSPFDVWEVRRAFSHLFPFEKISSQLMYNVYPKLNSYYPGGVYENPDNPILSYDKEKALRLLAKAGYRERDPETGLLINEDKQPLKVILTYRSPGLKSHLEMFQNACKDVGIALTLQLRSGAAAFNMAQQREYEMYSGIWGASSVPVPDTSWQGKKGSNNITGLNSEKINKWIEEYKREFDFDKRVKIMHKIDRELVRINPYILTWYAPFMRLLWWNKFSYPAGVVMRYEDYTYFNVIWWYDEEKARKLEEARKKGTPMLAGGTKNKFWDKYRDWLREQEK